MSDSNNELIGDDPSLRKELLRDAFGWVKTIVFAVVFALAINNFVIVNASIPTASMESTIRVNDRIVAFRLAYLFSEPETFDIVVFRRPQESQLLYVKRIIGVPGDEVNIEDGRVFVNDAEEPLRYDFVNGELFGNFGPVTVPEGKFFVLGDNRGNSNDSRTWSHTFIDRDQVLGKVVFRYFPGFQSLANS